MQNGEQDNWSASAADAYYGFSRWGKGHFSVDPDGALCVHPMADSQKIRIMDVVEEARQSGLNAPLTIRVQDLLRKRVVELNEAFAAAVEAEQYPGHYQGVFPIKVNQLREVVDEILDAGKPWQFGLEAGSKPELLIALAMLQTKNALLVCNGYKDPDYIRLAMLGTRLGKKVVIVIEQPSEADMIIQVAKEMQVTPIIGLRLKLSTTGEGRWSTSSGDHAKFGLSAPEIVSVVKKLRRAGLKDAVQLVHFHIGSQVPSIITLKKAVVEAARYYCELHKMGLPMKYLDCGGGLGIDYDGSRSNFDSSANYSLQEYARDMVFNIKSVCESADVPPPDIVTESGRALVALHSILVVEVVDSIAKNDGPAPAPTTRRKRKEPQVLKDLREILNGDEHWTPLERFHDAQQKKEEAQSLFSLGYLDLESRAETERLYWEICRRLQAASNVRGYVPDDLAELSPTLADQYVCNFSVFQSLLDHWALDQLFPIAPIHRLDEEPNVEATLVDITCDSDGKVSQFIDLEDVKQSLRLHPLTPGKPYYLGIFLVGAYQDIMG
ncbi:MAG: biosynthetic arginine decarboxylase, partial [Puniceicoccales bacterium]